MNHPQINAADVARYLGEEAQGTPRDWWETAQRRWPGLTPSEFRRAVEIAAEVCLPDLIEERGWPTPLSRRGDR
jgi:hypothetical protein